jgi:hypothetical protein
MEFWKIGQSITGNPNPNEFSFIMNGSGQIGIYLTVPASGGGGSGPTYPGDYVKFGNLDHDIEDGNYYSMKLLGSFNITLGYNPGIEMIRDNIYRDSEYFKILLGSPSGYVNEAIIDRVRVQPETKHGANELSTYKTTTSTITYTGQNNPVSGLPDVLEMRPVNVYYTYNDDSSNSYYQGIADPLVVYHSVSGLGKISEIMYDSEYSYSDLMLEKYSVSDNPSQVCIDQQVGEPPSNMNGKFLGEDIVTVVAKFVSMHLITNGHEVNWLESSGHNPTINPNPVFTELCPPGTLNFRTRLSCITLNTDGVLNTIFTPEEGGNTCYTAVLAVEQVDGTNNVRQTKINIHRSGDGYSGESLIYLDSISDGVDYSGFGTGGIKLVYAYGSMFLITTAPNTNTIFFYYFDGETFVLEHEINSTNLQDVLAGDQLGHDFDVTTGLNRNKFILTIGTKKSYKNYVIRVDRDAGNENEYSFVIRDTLTKFEVPNNTDISIRRSIFCNDFNGAASGDWIALESHNDNGTIPSRCELFKLNRTNNINEIFHTKAIMVTIAEQSVARLVDISPYEFTILPAGTVSIDSEGKMSGFSENNYITVVQIYQELDYKTYDGHRATVEFKFNALNLDDGTNYGSIFSIAYPGITSYTDQNLRRYVRVTTSGIDYFVDGVNYHLNYSFGTGIEYNVKIVEHGKALRLFIDDNYITIYSTEEPMYYHTLDNIKVPFIIGRHPLGDGSTFTPTEYFSGYIKDLVITENMSKYPEGYVATEYFVAV